MSEVISFIDSKTIKGLSDAEIIGIKKEDYQYDYRKKNPIRNSLTIVLDAKSAMCSTFVKEIILYNYKIIDGKIDFINAWWFSANIIECNKKKRLKLLYRCPNLKIAEITISFDEIRMIND